MWSFVYDVAHRCMEDLDNIPLTCLLVWHDDALAYGNITLEALEALVEFLGTLCVITMVVTMEIKPLLFVGAPEVLLRPLMCW